MTVSRATLLHKSFFLTPLPLPSTRYNITPKSSNLKTRFSFRERFPFSSFPFSFSLFFSNPSSLLITMRFLNHVNNTRPCRPRRILCVSKLTSLEYLRSQNADLDVDQILSRMKGEGLNPDDILAEHQRQIACEQNLISVLNKLDISFRITKRYRQEESYYVIYFNARWNSWLRLCTATNVRREKDIYIYVRWNVTYPEMFLPPPTPFLHVLHLFILTSSFRRN